MLCAAGKIGAVAARALCDSPYLAGVKQVWVSAQNLPRSDAQNLRARLNSALIETNFSPAGVPGA